MRVSFLVLTPVSIFLGFATAIATAKQIHYIDLLLVFVGALAAHVSVNAFNEYHDFRSGLDAKTVKTPFSGGSGALVENPGVLNAVLYLATAALAVTVLVGLYFVFSLGVLILPLGIVGVLIILSYTQWLNRDPFFCLIAPGLAFGPLMVVGTHVVLTGQYSLFALLVSLVPFLMVNNLLLLNQYPDIAADKSVGRRHFPIVYGVRASSLVYGVSVVVVAGIIVAGTYTGMLEKLSAIALIPLVLAAIVFFGALKHGTCIPKLVPYMGMNVLVTLLTPVLLGVGVIFG